MSAEGTGLEPDPAVNRAVRLSTAWSTPVSFNPPAADPRDEIHPVNRCY